MNAIDMIAGGISVVVLVYLIYAFLFPERF